MDSQDPYDILGVPATASSDQIKAVYRDLAKQHHPDRFHTYAQRNRASRRMQEINDAYRVLRDPEKRRAYDRQMGKARPIVDAHATGGGAATREADVGRSTVGEDPFSRLQRKDAIDRAIEWLCSWRGWSLAGVLVLVVRQAGPFERGPWWYEVGLAASFPFALMVGAGLVFSLAATFLLLPFVEKLDQVHGMRPERVRRDLLIRVAVLALLLLGSLIPIIQIVAWAALFPYGLILLAEVCALLIYLVRTRRVVAETEALLRV